MNSLDSSPGASPFLLQLPVELRLRIYGYILPYTSTLDLSLQRGDGEPERSEYNLTFVHETAEQGVWKMQKTHPRTGREVGHDIVWRRLNSSYEERCAMRAATLYVAYDSMLENSKHPLERYAHRGWRF